MSCGKIWDFSSYRSAIREALRPALTAPCPMAYQYVWKLGVAGVLNLNLDRLATKALSEVSPGRLPTEFSGRDAGKFLHSLKSPHPFVANLHGIGDDSSTWVFTTGNLKNLLRSKGYQTFIRSCLATTTTFFLGIGDDDIAAGGHIEALTHAGIDTGPHYWLTSRDDLGQTGRSCPPPLRPRTSPDRPHLRPLARSQTRTLSC